jgi:hypothetical protein
VTSVGGAVGDGAAAFAAAESALAARDAELAGADRQWVAGLARAHARALESIRKLGGVGEEIDTAAGRQLRGAADARELARLLLAAQRETAAIVKDAQAFSVSEAAVWNELARRYR